MLHISNFTKVINKCSWENLMMIFIHKIKVCIRPISVIFNKLRL